LALDGAPDGNIYLVALTTAEMSGENDYWRKLQPGEMYYVAYRRGVDQTQWQPIPITAVPRTFHPNLMIDARTLFIDRRSTVTFVDLALKAKTDADPRIDSHFRKWPTQ
jgi:hypothetical protein